MRTHRDLSFEVDAGEHTKHFRKAKDAMAHAFVLAGSGQKVTFNVLAGSRAAARAWAGEDGAASYDEDPDASVFEKYELSIIFLGRIA